MADKIILKFKTKNILNFYEIEPRTLFLFLLYFVVKLICVLHALHSSFQHVYKIFNFSR